MRSRKKSGALLSNVCGTLLSAVCGFIVVFAAILLFSFLMTKIDVSDSVLSVLTSVALCTGAYVGGYISARRRRQNGLLMGLLCGLFMFTVIFVVSYFFAGTAGGFSGSAKFVMTLVSAAFGGIIGVNTRGRRFKI